MVENIKMIRDMVEAASLSAETFKQPMRGELDKVTFEQWCRDAGAGARSLETVRLWCRGTLGQDPNEVSALAYLEIARGGLGIVNLRYDGREGAQFLRLEEGTQSISVGMAKLLPASSLKLSTPVVSITQHTPKLYVATTESGHNFKARKVIVTIPSPAYRNITFSPPLGPQKQVYITATRYGCFIKFICLFKSPFWQRQGSCGLAQSFCGPINHCRDTSVNSKGNYALTCFLCAGPGRSWMALNENDRRDAVMKQLGSLFGVGYEAVKAEFLGSITSGWMEDKWAGWGCPFAATPPNVIADGAVSGLASLKSGGVYFVGTELVDEWRGYMDGALRSGIRGAGQALADLRLEDDKL